MLDTSLTLETAPGQTLVLSGTVLTMADDPRGGERAVAVRDGVIDAVDGLGLADTPGALHVDFGGRPVLPGFVDPHAHLEVTSVARHAMVDCRAPTHATIDDVLQTLSEHAAGADGEWLVGQANLFFDQKLADGRLPTREELDRVSTTRPIILRAGGHRSVLNTRALEISDVGRYIGQAGMMGGAVVELGSDGQPNGVIAELDKALNLPELSPDELERAIEDGARELFLRHGVTSVGEISESRTGLELLDGLLGSGRLPLRLAMYLWSPGTCSVAEACEWSTLYPRQADTSRLTIRGVKLFADGGYSSRNAATRTPYLHWCGDPDHACGRVSLDADEILDALGQTNDAGLQLAVHANGERAQDVVCAAVRSFGPTGLPVRVEHAGNVLTEPGALAAWGEAGIVPIPQPVFLYNFGAFLPTYLGDPLQQGRFPFRTLLEAGWRIPGSSDCHLGCEERQTNPMFGVWCCVARRGFHGEPIGPEESVDVVDALRMHTLFAAEALGQEAERGSLEPGKRGDVVVLDRDPRQVAPDDLADVQVDFVFVDGQVAFARDGAESPTIRKAENGQ